MSNTPERSSRAQGEVASTLLFKFSRKEMITWHEMRQFQQPHHYTVWQWRFYPIVQTCKKWVMTLSSSMAMYSVMRDIPDARNVPMERGWVALYLYATCTFSNKLTLEQWAFEYGLPFFLYALYTTFCALYTLMIHKSLKGCFLLHRVQFCGNDLLLKYGHKSIIYFLWQVSLWGCVEYSNILGDLVYTHVTNMRLHYDTMVEKCSWTPLGKRNPSVKYFYTGSHLFVWICQTKIHLIFNS